MSYASPLFLDRAACEAEQRRVFEICNGCRLCFNLCPSFDALFKRIDALDPYADEASGKHLDAAQPQGMVGEEQAADLLARVEVRTEDPAARLSAADRERVASLCYGCQLCHAKCPFAPPHPRAVDFPKLMLRAKAVEVEERGLGLRERVLGAPDVGGRLLTRIAPLANAAAHSPLARGLLEGALGIARDRLLPGYAEESFPTWWSRRAPLPPPGPRADGTPAPRAALFSTCFGSYHRPAIPQAAVFLLERAGCDLTCPESACCGLPKLDAGDVEGARAQARRTAELLLPAVREGRALLSPAPSCTLMLQREYPQLLGAEGEELAATVRDLSDFLLGLARQGLLERPPAGLGKVAFHVACHGRVQGTGYRGRDLLKWAGAEVALVDKCCGMDGTWGMKAENFAPSLQVAEAAARKVEAAAPEAVSADCPLAGLQLEQKTGRRAFHPAELLRAAYQGAPLRSPAPEPIV